MIVSALPVTIELSVLAILVASVIGVGAGVVAAVRRGGPAEWAANALALLGLSVPKRFGGRCESDVSWCAYVEELANVSGTVSLMAAYVKLVSLPLLLAGS